MDKRKSVLNVTVSIAFRVLLFIAAIITRRILIQYIGNEANGINSLYTSIIGVIAVAELGVGSSISFSMYKPIVSGDVKKVTALYCLYKRLYRIISVVILICGIIVLPFLPSLAGGYSSEKAFLYKTFLLSLCAVLMSYVYSAKTSLINAYKNNYITTTITSAGDLVIHAFQVVAIVYTRSFELYLVCGIIGTALQWIATELVANKKYREIITGHGLLDAETKKEVSGNVKALFMHKIGGVLVNSADSIIISYYIGVVSLGLYSNYTTIVVAMMGFLGLFFTPLVSVVGHMYAEEGGETAQRYFCFFHSFNYVIGVVFFLGYYAVIKDCIILFFGKNLVLPRSIAATITINYFIQFLRQSALLFRDATGTFYNDRWKPLFEGICNVALSILFVKVFPDDYRIVGVLVATIITNLLICHIVEPYVLYKYAFREKVFKYYVNNYVKMVFFILLLLVLDQIMVTSQNVWKELIINGGIAVFMGIIAFAIELILSSVFRYYVLAFAKNNR